MTNFKAITTKTFALSLIPALATACGSVTDATFSEQPAPPAAVSQPDQPAPETFGNKDDVQPIYDRPTLDEDE
ncbi:MAG: hypothetical protein U5K69_01885 [Balneolaceae bacterium]|nr:hypothetical protein [Balneolaceae bacterium]